MSDLYILRHPQTTWNAAERYQGRLEAPLSAEGQRQARLAADAFRGQPLDAVYSSPLIRALHLAREIVRVTNVPLVVDHRLTEIAMGPWEGLERHEIMEKFSELFEAWYRRPDLVHFPEGECIEDVRLRSQSFLKDVFPRYPDGNLCIVTHSAVIQVLVCTALGLDLRYMHRVHTANAGKTTLCGDAAPGSLISLNVTEALKVTSVGGAATRELAASEKERIAS